MDLPRKHSFNLPPERVRPFNKIAACQVRARTQPGLHLSPSALRLGASWARLPRREDARLFGPDKWLGHQDGSKHWPAFQVARFPRGDALSSHVRRRLWALAGWHKTCGRRQVQWQRQAFIMLPAKLPLAPLLPTPRWINVSLDPNRSPRFEFVGPQVAWEAQANTNSIWGAQGDSVERLKLQVWWLAGGIVRADRARG